MEYDVVVIGKGNAALCAALSAREQGASVVMLEAATEEESGGNSRFAGGVMRFVYETVEDLRRVTDISDLPATEIDFPEDLERARREVFPKLQGVGE